MLRRALMTTAFPKPATLRALTLTKAVPARPLHSTRTALDGANFRPNGPYQGAHARSNVHVLDSPAITTWQEMPKGGINRGPGAFKKIWYNHGVVPLYITCAVAAGLCGWFLYKYFAVNVEIAWSKSMRGTYDHTGLNDYRAEKHSQRLLYSGIRDRNKEPVKMFPFNFIPMHQIAEKRFIDYNAKEE